MPPFVLSEEDKSSLSEAELAAFEDIDPGAIFDGKPPAITDTDEEGEGEPEVVIEDEPEVEEKLVDPDKPVGADQDEDEPEKEGQPDAGADPDAPDIAEADIPFPDAYVATFTAEDQAALKAAQDEIKALRLDYNNGELTDEEFDAKLAPLDDKRVDLLAKQKVDKAQEEKAIEVETGVWNKAVATWMGYQKIAIDPATSLPVGVPQAMWTAFDDTVKAVTGGDLGKGLTMKAQLDIARDIFEKKHPGVLPPIVSATKGKGVADPKKGKAAKAKAEAEAAGAEEVLIPPNMKGIGSADRSGIDESRFALVDRAGKGNPVTQEKMLANMSDAEIDAWTRTA